LNCIFFILSKDGKTPELSYSVQNYLEHIISINEREISENNQTSSTNKIHNSNSKDSKKISIQYDSDDDDDLKNCDFNQMEANYSNMNKTLEKSISTIKRPLSVEDLKSAKNIKFDCLENLSNYKMCCLKNKPSLAILNETNFATCSHRIEGYFKTLIGPLSQSKLKWNQDCIVGDKKNPHLNLNAYLSNQVLETLIGLTCVQARDLFRKYKESKTYRTEDKNFMIFEARKKECENKIEEIHGIFNLKFDLDRNKFCVFNIANI